MPYENNLKEQIDNMRQEINDLKRERDIAKLTAKYTEMGYGDLAEETAIASVNGDMNTFFRNQQTVMDARVNEAVASMKKPAKADPDTKNKNNSKRKQSLNSFPLDDPFVAGYINS